MHGSIDRTRPLELGRRSFLGTLAAALAAGLGVVGLRPSPSPRFGPVTVARHAELAAGGVFLHVLHEGRDITRDCYYADDTGDGYAEVFRRGPDGRPYFDPAINAAARATVDGVTLRAGEPFARAET